MSKCRDIQGAEDELLREIESKKALFLKGSVVGEKAIESELRLCTTGNDYAWRAVQRSIQTIYSNYEGGLQKAYMKAYESHNTGVTKLWQSLKFSH